MFPTPSITANTSFPMDLEPPVRTSCIRYATSSTISHPRNIICKHGEASNFDVDVDTYKELKLHEKTMQKHRKQKAKGNKTQFTVYQRQELEKTFSHTQYVTPMKRRLLSEQLGISGESIQIWFKNRRVKWRKEQRHIVNEPVNSSIASFPVQSGLHFHYFGHVPYPSSKLMNKDAQMLFGAPTAHALNEDA